MELKEIGQLIRKRREFLKLRQEDLAELAGINLRTVNTIEQGLGNPSFNTLTKLGVVTGLELFMDIKKVT